MIKHWSDGLEPIDEKECKWQNATTAMIDEFDADKVKYMVTPVGHPNMLVLGFSETYKGELICATLVFTKEQTTRLNFDELMQERINVIKANLVEYKKQFDNKNL